MIYLLIYMVGIADRLSGILFAFGLATAFFYTLWLMVYVVADAEEQNKVRFKKWFVLLPVSFFLMSALIPSSNTLLAIGGVYGIEQAMKSDDGQKVKQLIFKKIDAELQNDNSK